MKSFLSVGHCGWPWNYKDDQNTALPARCSSLQGKKELYVNNYKTEREMAKPLGIMAGTGTIKMTRTQPCPLGAQVSRARRSYM